jgi:hypothetical protein
LPEAERQRIEADLRRAPRAAQAGPMGLRERAAFAALERARQSGAAIEGVPANAAALTEAVDARRRAELDEAETMLAFDPSWGAGFAGAGARAMTDPVSLALIPFGGAVGVGGKAALKFIGREAVLGTAGEALVLPREFRVADELGLEDPNIAQRLALGAAAGGAIGGGIVAGARAFDYVMGRPVPGKPDTLDADAHDADIAAIETDLLTGASPADTGAPSSVDAPGTLDDTVARIVQIESGGRPDARNPNSSAAGLGQFIDSTWLDMIRRHRPDLMEGRSRDEVLALKLDGDLNLEMTRIHTQENIAFLQARSLPAGPGEAYLAHFLGKGGALNVLRAGADVPIASIVSRGVLSANAGIRHNGKSFAAFTVGDLRSWAAAKMDSAPPATIRADGATFGGYSARGYTETGQVAAGDMVIDVRYEVVDASELTFASGDMQPRDRSRATSDEQIADIAARLDPARLMPSPEADRGAPVVGPDGMIESGNGRVRAIQRTAEVAPDRLGAYRRQIELAGYRVPDDIEVPVLVARRTSALDDTQRAAFAYRANSPDVARMSATEIARAHSRLIDGGLLGRLDMAQPLANQANRDFARGFLARLPQAERGAYTTARGGLSYDGERALEAALFARAFDAEDMLAQFAERGEPALKSFIAALQEAAPAWAALRAEIASGRVDPSLDISAFVNEALMLIGEARRIAAQTDQLGIAQAIEDMLAQDDMFSALSPLTAALVRKFFQNGRTASADKIAQFLKDYAGEAMTIGTGDLMGDLPGPLDVLRVLDGATFGGVDDIGRPRAAPDRAPPPGLAQDVPDLFGDVADGGDLETANRAALDAQADLLAAAAEVEAAAPRTPDEIIDATAPGSGGGQIIEFQALDKTDRLRLDAALRARQGFKSLDDMIEAAAVNHEALNDVIETVSAELGRPFKRAPLKGKERAQDKINDKYGGDINRATDIARGGMTAEVLSDADVLIARLAEKFHVIDEGWSVTPVGYFDRKATIVFDNGQLGELQIWPPGMLAAKEAAEVSERFGWPATYINDKGMEKPFKGGHALFEIWRRASTPEDQKAKAAEDMRALYGEVRAGLDPSFAQLLGGDAPSADITPSSSAAATGTDRVSDTISDATAGRQSVPDQTTAVSPDTAASIVPSESQNSMGNTSNGTVRQNTTESNAALSDARAELARLSETLDPETVDDVLAEIRATLDEVEAEDALAGVMDACTLRLRGGAA